MAGRQLRRARRVGQRTPLDVGLLPHHGALRPQQPDLVLQPIGAGPLEVTAPGSTRVSRGARMSGGWARTLRTDRDWYVSLALLAEQEVGDVAEHGLARIGAARPGRPPPRRRASWPGHDLGAAAAREDQHRPTLADDTHLIAGPQREQRLGRLPVLPRALTSTLPCLTWISVTTASGSCAQASAAPSTARPRRSSRRPCPHVSLLLVGQHLEDPDLLDPSLDGRGPQSRACTR